MTDAETDLDGPVGDDPDRHAVLDVFGLKLEVSNPRLAELLTMDARHALKSDVKDLLDPERLRESQAEMREALPEAMVSAPTPRDEEEARARETFARRVERAGGLLGFEVCGHGDWESSEGLTLVVRTIERELTFAAASHYIAELAAHRFSACDAETSALFVVDSTRTAGVFKVAIRQARQHHQMRTVTVEDLETMQVLHGSGRLDHGQALVMLSPLADVDAAVLLDLALSGRDLDTDEHLSF